MSVFANVNGEIKELYRVFFNDNGVIREYESFHTQNDNNEIKEIFVRNSNIPRELFWVTYDNDSSAMYSITNNGYTINGRFTEKKRSVSTSHKVYLLAGTQIRVELSNTVYNAPVEIFDRVNIFLFDTESTTTPFQSDELIASSNTMTVQTTGNYYISLSIFGRDSQNNIHYFTTDVNIFILPPKN